MSRHTSIRIAHRLPAILKCRRLLTLALGAMLPAASPAAGSEPRASIAIFKDDLPAPGAASSPDTLAAALQRAGFDTAFLNSERLADAQQLNYRRFDVLVLPYGPSFPVNAANNFRKFLREGGKFFSTGGYAFDDLLERTSGQWRPYQPPTPPSLDGAAWFYDIPVAELRGRGKLAFRGFLKTEAVAGAGFAHFSVYQYAADGSLPAWRDICQARGSGDWKEYQYTFDVHPQAARISLRAGLFRCRGTAWFDDVRLADEAGNVLLNAGFEQPSAPDRPEPRNWWRSHTRLCQWQNTVAHGGSNALKAALEFEIPRIERLNTRHGRPEDGLEVEPTQLGVFQADYPLERASFALAAPMQTVVPASLRLEGALEGWAACGLVGWDNARWIPLINAHDRYGRLRGAAGAMLRHYAGTWAGSSWAYMGVTNRDLFAAAEPGMSNAFIRMIDSLARDTYFTSLTPDRGSYEQGEAVKLLAPVFNGGRQTRELRVTLELFAGEPDDLGIAASGSPTNSTAELTRRSLTNFSFTVQTPARQTNVVTFQWQPRRFTAGFFHLVAHLWDGANELDRIESGFVARDAQALASGPKLNYHDNYLHFGERPLFLFGTDDWSYVFNTARETPLQWLRDMRQRRDLGVLIYENLQAGLPRSPAHQAEFFRKVNGVVQLAQKYGQVYFPGLLVGYNAATSDAELATQRAYCGDFARQYGKTPGLIYYLNGDYRCEISAAVTPQWNQFLRERYGSDAKLREAWGRFAPSQPLGQIPAEEYRDWEQTWDDVSAFDRNQFRTWLMRRWNAALIAGIRESDATHPTSGEFYQLPHSGVDLPAGIGELDLSNFGFFEKPGADLAKFPALCKYNDQRARGKSGGPGEYGVKTHPAWGDGKDYGYHIARTREQAVELFLAIPHYSLGLGASRIHNWCWKDDAHRVFPWGMVYPCDGVPKEIALVHRNVSLLFRHFAPVCEPPEVFILTPDSHRLGGAKWRVIDGVLASIDLALTTHVHNLGVLNEQWLEIPAAAKAIYYPLPFCPPDAAYAKILDWVKRGGVLYLSGDISYDELRRRSRTGRLEELCGARFLGERYPNISLNPTNAADQPCIRVEPAGAEVVQRAADGSPLLMDHRLGRGRVLFTTDPLELHSTPARQARDLALYQRILDTAGVKPIGIEPADSRLHVFQVPLRDQGKLFILFNTDQSQPSRTVTLTDLTKPVTLTVAARRPALVWLDGTGSVRAVETQGECRVGGQPFVTDETRGVLLTLDGRKVSDSRALLLMPLQAGQVRWSSPGAWAEPTIETGELVNGAWRSFETLPLAKTSNELRVQAGNDQALSLLLVCERTELPRWRQALERALVDPASLP